MIYHQGHFEVLAQTMLATVPGIGLYLVSPEVLRGTVSNGPLIPASRKHRDHAIGKANTRYGGEHCLSQHLEVSWW